MKVKMFSFVESILERFNIIIILEDKVCGTNELYCILQSSVPVLPTLIEGGVKKIITITV